MYDMKALYEAYSVEEAVKLRLEHPEAQIIAGGTDVLVQMREGRRAGKELISIQKIDSMRGVCMEENENIRIGSLTTFSHITHNPIIIEKINVLGEAVDMVGGPQIRNAGTIGGNTCNGVTSADSASTLHAWEAIVELTGVNGKRYLPIKDFYIKAGTVDINVAEGEIQTAILIPKASWENTKGFYIKYGMRNAMEIATTGCSVNVRLSADKKTFDRVRIGYGVAGPVPMRAPTAEAFLTGKPVTMVNLDSDAIERTVTITPTKVKKLLVPHVLNGQLAIELPSIAEKKAYIAKQLTEETWESELRLECPHKHYVNMTPAVAECRSKMYAELHGGKV